MLGIFAKKDPICGMRQKKGQGMIDEKSGHWFCSENCRKEFENAKEGHSTKMKSHGGCCH